MGLIAVAGCVGTATVCYKHKVILDKIYRLLLSVLYIDYLLCNLPAAVILDYDILHVHSVFDANAVCLKIFYKRKYHTLVLIVLCEAQCAEVRKSVYVMNVTAEITLHFKSARPALESKHRLPIQPEIRAPEAVGENLRDLLVLKILFGR